MVLAGFYWDVVQCIHWDLASRENQDFVCSSWRGRSGLFHKNMVSLMALLSYPQPMRFNYCLGPPPIRSTYLSTPPPWHSHYAITHFSGEPSSKNRNFFFIPKDPI